MKGKLYITIIMFFIISGCSSANIVETSAPTQTITPSYTITSTSIPTRTTTFTPTTTISPTVTVSPSPVPDRISPIDGMTMVFIPPGEFLMGSTEDHVKNEIEKCINAGIPEKKCRDEISAEQPQHVVFLDGYWIDQTEVTHEMFVKFMNDRKYPYIEEEGETHWIINAYPGIHHYHHIIYENNEYYVELSMTIRNAHGDN